jgi:hypothetical protein
MKSPFAKHSLFRNPFGELTSSERAELAVLDIEPFLDFLSSPKSVLQFVGDCGRGKSTHLLALQRCLENAPYIYIPEQKPAPKLPSIRPLLVDESQRLPNRTLVELARSGGPLVLGTHSDHTSILSRYGLQVRTVQVSKDLNAETLRAIFVARIEASRSTSGRLPIFPLSLANRMLTQFGSDIRAMEYYLYDRFQANVIEHQPWPPAD